MTAVAVLNPITTQALRVYERYAIEVVEALNVCPWAAQARQAGRVQTRVVLGEAPATDQVLAQVDAVEGDEDTDIGLLIFPQLLLDRPAFRHYAAAVRQADADRRARGATVVAMADFHPDAGPDLESPERLVPFIRRSPDPTIQLVRRSVLDRVRMTENEGTSFVDPESLASFHPQKASVEPLAARVARANLKTVQRMGVEEVEAILRDIHRDRHDSYAELGLPPAPWAKSG